jgi:hypothetical protein
MLESAFKLQLEICHLDSITFKGLLQTNVLYV